MKLSEGRGKRKTDCLQRDTNTYQAQVQTFSSTSECEKGKGPDARHGLLPTPG